MLRKAERRRYDAVAGMTRMGFAVISQPANAGAQIIAIIRIADTSAMLTKSVLLSSATEGLLVALSLLTALGWISAVAFVFMAISCRLIAYHVTSVAND